MTINHALSNEPSTLEVQAILADHGIPCVTGYATDNKYVDLMAWACVPIEAKVSTSRRDSAVYSWHFSPQQMLRGFSGCFVFVAKSPNRRRVFIVPAYCQWLQRDGRPIKNAVFVTFGSDHHNSKNAELIEPYEDAYHYIEEARLAWRSKTKE